jgi:hypothetical protein
MFKMAGRLDAHPLVHPAKRARQGVLRFLAKGVEILPIIAFDVADDFVPPYWIGITVWRMSV